MFVQLKVDGKKCAQAGSCEVCSQVCPVDIFTLRDGKLTINHDNEDECTLCDLCLSRCPTKAIALTKLY